MNGFESTSKSPLPPFFKGGKAHVMQGLNVSFATVDKEVTLLCLTETLQTKHKEPSAAAETPPLKKGGRGDLLLALLDTHTDEAPDRLDHRVRLQQHLSIVESKNLQSHAAQNIGSPCIGKHRRFSRMLAAIDFHDQLNRRRVEIGYVLPERLLAIELHAMQLLSSLSKPQSVLCVGHAQAQASGDRFRFSGIGKHAAMTTYRSRLRYRRLPPRVVG